MNVLMVGVDASTRGGMWSVVENYLKDESFAARTGLIYVPLSVTRCNPLKKILFTCRGLRKIKRILQKEPITLVHVHMSERGSILRKGIVMKMAQKKGIKIVLHMHGAEFEVLYRQMTLKKQKKVRDILNLADRIIVLGEYWRPFISSLVKDPSSVRVVHNAVKIPDVCLYDNSCHTVLFLGEVSQRKGIHVLLEALKAAEDRLASFAQVRIFGTDVTHRIEEKIDRCGLSSWVFYGGYLEGDRKHSELMHTAVNVLPSYNEGLPMTILETMAFGIPSVAAAVAAVPEAVHSSNGILVPPGDSEALKEALIRILCDDDLREALSRQAYQDAKASFSIEKHLSAIETIYQELI